MGFPDAASEAPAEFDRKIVNSAANPLLIDAKILIRSRPIQGSSSAPRYEGSRKSAPIGPCKPVCLSRCLCLPKMSWRSNSPSPRDHVQIVFSQSIRAANKNANGEADTHQTLRKLGKAPAICIAAFQPARVSWRERAIAQVCACRSPKCWRSRTLSEGFERFVAAPVYDYLRASLRLDYSTLITLL